MNEPPDNQRTTEETVGSFAEIDLHELFCLVREKKIFIIAATLIPTIIASIVFYLMPDRYRAETTLVPAQNNPGSEVARLAGQLGSIGGLVGLDVSGARGTIDVGIEILKSRKFLTEFISRHDLAIPLHAAKSWDEENRKLNIDASIYNPTDKTWLRSDGNAPSALEGFKEFRDILSVQHNSSSGILIVGLEHVSPVLAKQWLHLLIQDLNNTMKASDVADSKQAIAYLEDQIETTAQSAMKEIFYRLIEEHSKTIMLASISDEYFLRTIDPPFEPEEPIGPPAGLLILAVGMIGFFSALLISWLVFAARSRK